MTYRYKLVYKTRVLSSHIRTIFVLLLPKSCKLSIHDWESVGVFLSKHFIMVSVVVFRVKMETTRSSLIVVTTYDTINLKTTCDIFKAETGSNFSFLKYYLPSCIRSLSLFRHIYCQCRSYSWHHSQQYEIFAIYNIGPTHKLYKQKCRQYQ